ncbi:hypothetical protein F4680DRAFT_409708 [Xylaria scruposa]|nr:hypothetical protein F4680DRAFT_409708 [Xylaria scruposa]
MNKNPRPSFIVSMQPSSSRLLVCYLLLELLESAVPHPASPAMNEFPIYLPLEVYNPPTNIDEGERHRTDETPNGNPMRQA